MVNGIRQVYRLADETRTRLMLVWLTAIGCLAADRPKAIIERLSLAQRATVLMALVVLLLAGIVLVVMAWQGGRFTRRWIKREPRTIPRTEIPVRPDLSQFDNDATEDEDDTTV